MKLKLKVGEIIEIFKEKYNVAKIMETADPSHGKTRLCKDFHLHKLGNKSLFPDSIIVEYHDNEKIKFNGKK